MDRIEKRSYREQTKDCKFEKKSKKSKCFTEAKKPLRIKYARKRRNLILVIIQNKPFG
jgi:hypothetical protein